MPINTPEVSVNIKGVVANAIPVKPSAYSKAPTTMTLNAPNRSAAIPAKMPVKPHIRF